MLETHHEEMGHPRCLATSVLLEESNRYASTASRSSEVFWKHPTNACSGVGTSVGFIAALDQSGGSAPIALRRYGLEVADDASTQEIFDLMHRWKGRVLASPSLTGDGVVGAILFEDTLDRTIDGRPVAEYLWGTKQVVPIVKIDQGMAETVAFPGAMGFGAGVRLCRRTRRRDRLFAGQSFDDLGNDLSDALFE